MSEAEEPEARVKVHGGQGIQLGSGNVQNNTFMAPAPARHPVGPVVVGQIPQEPLAFQPREDVLKLLRLDRPGVLVVSAVTGLRGVGKTQIAAAFARECARAGWQLVGWVDAQDEASVLAGLALVADRLGIAPGAGVGDAALAVRNWLEADGSSCLLVLDNAPTLAAVREYLPATGNARVVVTTTGQTAGLRATLVPVNIYSEDEGLTFLAERTNLSDRAGARAVAEELGWLPLGLAQAGAVIARDRLSYPVYLDRLRRVPVDEYLLTDPDDAYPRGVAEAVLLSLETITGGTLASTACEAILELVSVLSPSGVSRSLLHAAADSGALPGCTGASGTRLVDEALGRVAAGSLLTFSGDSASVAAHRLVMRVVREHAAKAGTLAGLGLRACGVLDSVMGSLGEPWQHRAAARDLIGQVLSLHEHLLPCLNASPDLEAGLLALRGRALSWLNDLADSAGLAAEVGSALLADCVRVLGEGHPDTVLSRNNLAFAYQAAGRLGEAIALFEATLADRVRVLGEGHPATLSSRNNLAAAYDSAGRLGEAIALFEATLADCVRVLGEGHPATLSSRNNLAAAYNSAGLLDEAVPLCEANLADCVRALGEGHPDTLMSRNNLAGAYREAGRLGEAIALFEATLADRVRVLGEGHPDTLRSRNNLAGAYRAAGRVGEAIPLYEAALAGLVRVLGENHPDTRVFRDNLAVAYQAAEQVGRKKKRFGRRRG